MTRNDRIADLKRKLEASNRRPDGMRERIKAIEAEIARLEAESD